MTPALSAQVKPVIHGISSMGDTSFMSHNEQSPDNRLSELAKFPGAFDATAVTIAWRQLQPDNGAELKTTALDQVLDAVQRYNATAGRTHPIRIELRIVAGPHAPDWAKTIGGAPITIDYINFKTQQMRSTATIGRFWSEPYRQAWRQLLNRLGAIYDKNPLIAEIANTSCSSHTNEPFVMSLDPTSLNHMTVAGLTDESRERCLEDSLNDYDAWPSTAVDFAFNAFVEIDNIRAEPAENRRDLTFDMAFTETLMREFREKFGPARGVISFHGFDPQDRGREQRHKIVDMMLNLGQPYQLQTRGWRDDWPAVMQAACALQPPPTAFELWISGDEPGSRNFYTLDELRQWSSEFSGRNGGGCQ